MADKLLDIRVDNKQLTRLQDKLSKYPPYAIKKGMEAVQEYLNDSVLQDLYPPSQTGQSFEWSSDKQRMAYFASDGFGAGIPYSRTYELMTESQFSVEQSSFQGTPYSSISFRSNTPYAKFVVSPDAIVGHIKRGWKPVSTTVMKYNKNIAKVFEQAAKNAYDEMDSFMFGGGGSL